MKKFFFDHLKAFRITAAVIAFVMIAGLLYCASELVGNPVSYFLVKHNAEKMLAENYADQGYVLEEVGYNWKFGNYYAGFSIPGSEDNHFGISYHINGKPYSGDFRIPEQLSSNVRIRLEMRYRDLVNSVVDSPSYPYSDEIAYGSLDFEYDMNYGYIIAGETLVTDGLYDIAELGAKAGQLTIYVPSDGEVTHQKAAEKLLEINSLMKQGGVTFHTIDLSYGGYNLDNFPRSDIYEDGLTERVRANWLSTEEYNAKLDAMKKEEIE